MGADIKSEKQIKLDVLEKLAGELLGLSKKYKNSDKGCGVQDAYAYVVGFKNSIKNKND